MPAFFGSAPAAIGVLQNLLRLNPRETEYRVKLALLSFRQGEVETAIANLREVLAEKPDHPFALPAIARFTIETGDEASARPLLARIPAQPEILPRDQQAVLAQYRGRFGHDP